MTEPPCKADTQICENLSALGDTHGSANKSVLHLIPAYEIRKWCNLEFEAAIFYKLRAACGARVVFVGADHDPSPDGIAPTLEQVNCQNCLDNPKTELFELADTELE